MDLRCIGLRHAMAAPAPEDNVWGGSGLPSPLLPLPSSPPPALSPDPSPLFPFPSSPPLSLPPLPLEVGPLKSS